MWRYNVFTGQQYTLTSCMSTDADNQGSENTRRVGRIKVTQHNNTKCYDPKSYYRVTWVNWTCSPMRTRIYVVLVVDVALSQRGRDQRIKLRLSWATLHFTDRWAASQPLPLGDRLTYLASMCVSLRVCMWMYASIYLHPSLVECWMLFSIFLSVCVNIHMRVCERGEFNKLWACFSPRQLWLAAWTMGSEPGHLTWALTLIAHCSNDRRGDKEVKTSGSREV